MHENSAALYSDRTVLVSLEYTTSVAQQCTGFRWRKRGSFFLFSTPSCPPPPLLPAPSQHPMRSHPSHRTAVPPVESILALSYTFSKAVWINDRASTRTKENSCISVSHIQLEQSPAGPARGLPALHSLLSQIPSSRVDTKGSLQCSTEPILNLTKAARTLMC